MLDGDPLAYQWSWEGGTAPGVAPTVLLPWGTTELTLWVSDGEFTGTDTVTILVRDTTAPKLDLQVLVDSIWPPNHKLVKAVEVRLTDAPDARPTVQIQVSHNEVPHDNTGAGDGNTEPDWQIDPDGGVWVRAERDGTGQGRVYTITVRVTDTAGTTASASAQIIVPHDQGSGKKS